ncbi:hypothetical protein N9164_13640 [Draconibacterium sp.]|nr:hypothetical protein [Draconibacterium sp.]
MKRIKKYINDMVAQGYHTNNVEDLEPEDLKGASGLSAFRIEVSFSDLAPITIHPAAIEELAGQN